MKKDQLRLMFLEKRKALSRFEWNHKSELIAKHFFEKISLGGVSVIHSFLPIEKNKEPNTWLIIEKLKEHYPQIFIVLPKIDAASNSLVNYFYNEESPLGINDWGILEPASGFEVEPSQIDMILIPLLAFDQFGNRVGYGKGFYDAFIAECRPETQRIGISLFEGVDQIDDVSHFDQPLNACITPDGVINFR